MFMLFRKVFVSIFLLLLLSGVAHGDEDCLVEVRNTRMEIAESAKLLAMARGALDEADALCRAGKVEEALQVLQSIKDQTGMSMGQGQ